MVYWRLVSIALLALALGSCKMLELEADQKASSKEGLVRGKVAHQEKDFTKVVVFVLRDDAGATEVHNYSSLAAPNAFLMRADPGRSYLVGAFADRNGNQRLDPGEPAGMAAVRATVAPGWRGAGSAELALRTDAPLPAPVVEALRKLPEVERKALPLAVGALAELDDERFSPESGQMGMWSPFEFAVNVGGGVYFLQPYDPKKIPVLFVNGIGGNPQEFRAFIEALDKSRYQPWVYLYPSGARLELSARILNASVEALHREYKFERLYVTAHSMGGLVSRGFIQLNTATPANRYLRLFVSVSTPWAGHAAAQMGVEYSPVVMQSWVDMQTNSDYQKSIFTRPFAAPLQYHLLWGRLDPKLPIEKADDGTVTAVSMLRPEAVRDALTVQGFVEGHTSILRSQKVIDTYLGILNAAK